ncbi:PTS system cellobiose-specific IIB component [Breznakia blatticola]|uniref:PTS system cellobiose-specific IIB component n=1 Tax=Breznakia blatticola TaxID=1754012 RepID=A0A4R8A6N8_9FIRM|nr:PTS sugar transporter subunit IIB [Breznakia blatticola]TDW26326.1 PTS system cellobiose-specific IIB component [Breznakia blatticola]
MIKIVLICAGGMSSSMLARNMEAAGKEKGLDIHIWAIGESEAVRKVDDAQIILLGPQIRYRLAALEKQFPELPVKMIDMQDYGMMNGKATLEKALKAIEEHK